MRLSVSLALATGAAYAFSFAVDLLLGGLIGVYPNTAFLPVITWSAISTMALLAARATSRGSGWLAVPYVALGLLAAFGGAVGSHPHNFAVAGLMFLHAYLLWKTARPVFLQGAFQDEAPTHSSFPIGEYRIDAPVEGIAGLREFSPAVYAVMGRQFEGEKNYFGLPVEFLGRQWDLMLGTVNGRIYKVAPLLEARSKQEANPIAMETLRYCTKRLGNPISQKTGLFTWDTTDGNVILQTTETAEGLAINLFVTTRAVRNFKRLR